MDARFDQWREAVQASLLHETVKSSYKQCTVLAPGHTYASWKVGEAYTFHDHSSLEQAKAFTTHVVTCYSGPDDDDSGATWQKTTFDELVAYFETQHRIKLEVNSQLWSEFKELRELVESVHVCGYVGCGTWEHSHFCVIFKVDDNRFVTFRCDISGLDFFQTEGTDPSEWRLCTFE